MSDEMTRQCGASFRVPVRLRIQQRETSGTALAVSPHGLQIATSAILVPGTALSVQVFLGAKTCFISLAGQVASCVPIDNGGSRGFSARITFADVREVEHKILQSALTELVQDPSLQERSFLLIDIAKDAMAEEVSRISERHPRAARKGRSFTPDPPWVRKLKEVVAPHWQAILECPLVQEAAAGTLSLRQMRAWLVQLYPFIETFPKWIALNIAKTQDPVSRAFMIDNVRVEKRHAEQWVAMAEGFGIEADELFTVRPIPQVEALTHWLWSINTQGSLPEAVGATNYAIEGITHDISSCVVKGFPSYDGREGLRLNKKTYSWMEAHAAYDDLHPIQALHVMKLYTNSEDLVEKVIFASQRSLEYMLMALNACYTEFPPVMADGNGMSGNSVASSLRK
jgi:pyrroloquinoline quinone (PQQ) biosynthesis protein C